MSKVLNRNSKAGSKKVNEPRLLGSILSDMLHSDSPLAVAYRDRLHPNTELCVDLKLLTRKPGRLPVGKSLGGALAHNGEQEFTFVEDARQMVVSRRYPLVYQGWYVNVHRHDDGALYPSFKRVPIKEDTDVEDFIRIVGLELRNGLKSLVGKE